MRIHIDGCRCDERLKTKTEDAERLEDTGLRVEHTILVVTQKETRDLVRRGRNQRT
jgi:hypothetical protein